MYCQFCGNKLNNKNECTKCKNKKVVIEEKASVGWWFLGFFFPIVGLILFCIWNDEKHDRAKKVGIGALIGFILKIVACVIVFFTGILFTLMGGFNILFENDIRCNRYCDNATYNKKDASCTCGDGTIYYLNLDENNEDELNNEENNKPSSFKNNDLSLEGASEEIVKWYNSFKDDNTVITVITLSYCGYCKQYMPVISKIANKEKLTLYSFDIDILSETDSKILTETFDLENYVGSSPYTFIVRNNKFVSDSIGYQDEEGTRKFLKESKVIKD